MEIPEAVTENLAANEEVLHCIRANKALSMDLTPKTLAVTDQRVIIVDHKVLGRYELQDIPYSKLETVRYEQGVATSKFSLNPEDGEAIEIAWLSRDGAKRAIETIRDALDAIAVEPVSIQRSKRMLDREEWVLHKPEELVSRRAAAGQPPKKGESGPLEQIRQLKSLRDAGAISEEEYEAKKEELLDQV
jgi:hypothetical protein